MHLEIVPRSRACQVDLRAANLPALEAALSDSLTVTFSVERNTGSKYRRVESLVAEVPAG
jgi:hypothetical protein